MDRGTCLHRDHTHTHVNTLIDSILAEHRSIDIQHCTQRQSLLSDVMLGQTKHRSNLTDNVTLIEIIFGQLYRIKVKVKVAHARYSITQRRVPELIPVLDSQPAGDVSHKPGGRLPCLSARPAVTLATIKRAATNFAAW